MDIEIRAEAVMEGRDYLALTRFMSGGKNKNSVMMNILLLLIAIVGVYADRELLDGAGKLRLDRAELAA